MNRIPDHILFPGMIISLLIFSTTMGLTILFVARSGNGAQVVDGYYDKALAWDENRALRQESEAMGWTLNLDVQVTEDLNHRIGHLRIEDARGVPLTGLRAQITLRRPNLSEAIAVVDLQELEDGHYVFPNHVDTAGIWDFVLKGERENLPYVAQLRREIHP